MAQAKSAIEAVRDFDQIAPLTPRLPEQPAEARGNQKKMFNDPLLVLRVAHGKQGQPSAIILDGQTLRSTFESGQRAGYDGYKRKNVSKT